MDHLLQDLRYAVRSLRSHRASTLVVVATLAIGIGANALIFSAVHALLLKRLPFPNPGELVFLFSSSAKRGVPKDVTSVPTYEDWRDQTSCFSKVAGVFQLNATLESEGTEAETVNVDYVTRDFFPLLGVPAALGRGFTPEEDVDGGPNVVVLSHRLFLRRFGGDAAALGKTLVVNSVPRQIVGVMPAELELLDDSGLYLPAAFSESQRKSRGSIFLPVIARLKTGVSLAQANAQLAAVSARLEKAYPEELASWTAYAVPFRDELSRDYRLAVLVLLGAVVAVLLIACANVANILLARLSSRGQEISVRLALGASRGRVLRQLLTESALVALVGGAVGVALAFWSLELLRASAPGGLAVWRTIRMDTAVLVYSAVVSLLTGLSFGSVPALHVLGGGLSESLRGARRVIGGSERRSQAALIVAEVAVAVVLLSASGLLLKSLRHIQATSPGFEAEGVLALDLKFPDARFADDNARIVHANEAVARLAQLPGVASVSGATTLPLGGLYNDTSLTVDGEPEPPPDQRKVAGLDAVLPGYFSTMGIPLKEGRDVSPTDLRSGPPVAVINETMARAFWPGRDPIGRTFRRGETRYTIVGVVGDARRFAVMKPDQPHMYLPLAQRAFRRLSVVLKAKGRPEDLIPSVRAAYHAFDAATPLDSLRPLARQVSDSVVLPRVVARLLTAFGALAMLLAALGLYGVLSYVVSQRTGEIGVRMALGAVQKDILVLVARRGLALTFVGLGIGLVLALATTRLLTGLLYEVEPTDPASLALAAAVLVTTAAAACFIPARRAARLDPVVALRTE